MQFVKENPLKKEDFKKTVISIPSTVCPNKIFDFDADSYCFDSGNTIIKLWNNQHPLINTWFILTTLSICCLSAFLFIIH